MSSRMEKINAEIHKQLSSAITFEMSDPRLERASVIRTETTSDLKFCKVYVSVLGTKDEQADAISALKRASGFLRTYLGKNMKIRIVPELIFIGDDSIEYSARLSKIIGEINK